MSQPESKQAATAELHPFDVTWRERVAVLVPLALVLLTAFLFANRYASDMLVELLGIIPVTFVAVGKFLPVWGITGQSSFGPYELGAVIWGLDTFTVIVFVYSFEAFYRIGPFRRMLDKLNTSMQLVIEVYPIMRQASVVGVLLFVLFPVSGTGALAASFIGVLLGMNRFILITAISAGGFLGGMLMAFLASNFASSVDKLEAVQNNPQSKYWIAAIAVAIVAGLVYLMNRAFRKALEEAESRRK